MSVSRRTLIGAAAAALVGEACGRLPAVRGTAPAPRSAPATIRVLDDTLHLQGPALVAAWARAHPGIALTIGPSYGGKGPDHSVNAPGMQRAGDVLAVSGDGGEMGGGSAWPDLTARVREQNFDLASLVPSALGAFNRHGPLRGLPLRAVPFGMAVHPSVAALGVGPRPGQPWTWQDLGQAVQRAAKAQPPPGGPLISGMQWADVRIWGALVLGLGGQLTDGGAVAIDAPSTVAATGQALDLALAARWPAGQSSGDPSPTVEGRAGAPLFFLGSLGGVDSFGALPGAVRFPVLPADPVVPLAEVDGLALSPLCAEPDAAVTFMLWLYEPAQQRTLIGSGVPPMVPSPELQAAWTAASGRHPAQTAPYDVAHMVDILTLLPAVPGAASYFYNNLLVQWLVEAQADPGGLAQDLASAQREIEAHV